LQKKISKYQAENEKKNQFSTFKKGWWF